MLVSQIISRVRRTIGDDSSIQINDNDIIGWINEAMKEIVTQVNLFQVIATASTVANQRDYSLPNNILKLHSVKWLGNSLKYLSPEQFETSVPNKDSTDNYPTGEPMYYSVWGNTITFYPAPASNGTNDIKIYYNRLPVDVTSINDTPDLPSIYHTRIIEYCLAQAHDLDDNIFGAELKMSQFQQAVQGMKELGEWEDQDYYPFITSSLADTTDFTFGGYTFGG